MKLNILICDDEPIVCEKIREAIHKVSPGHNVDLLYSAESVIDAADKYDVMFLDIEIGKANGMDTAKALRAVGCDACIVFLTSHDEFMPEAFSVRAYRFLTKPVVPEQIEKVLIDLETEMQNKKRIMIKSDDNIYLIKSDEILFIESYGDGTYIYTETRVIDSDKTIKFWTEELKNGFFQVHKSYIVSLARISSLDKHFLTIEGFDEKIPVSRRKYREFRKMLTEYIRMESRCI